MRLHIYHSHILNRSHTAAAGWTSFTYILKGKLKVGSEKTVHDPFHTLVLSADKTETGVNLTATANKTEIVLIAGEPLDQTVVQYGPFVMTTNTEITKTIMDCMWLLASLGCMFLTHVF